MTDLNENNVELELPEFIQLLSDGGYQITLNNVIKVDGVEIKEIVMNEPSVQDLLAAELQTKGKGNSALEIQMLSNLCGLAPENVKSMKLKDYKRLQVAYGLFTD